MSMSLRVGSIIWPESMLVGIPHSQNFIKIKEGYVKAICDIFGWEKVPWNEPTTLLGTFDTSFNSLKYSVAKMIASGDYIPTDNSSIEIPFGVLPKESWHEWYQPSPLSNFTKEERFEWFQHFLESDSFNDNFYLPIDFHPPKRFVFLNETVRIASSVRLDREMKDLLEELSFYIRRYGGESVIKPSNTYWLSWNDLYEFCDMLHNACLESINLNLPLELS